LNVVSAGQNGHWGQVPMTTKWSLGTGTDDHHKLPNRENRPIAVGSSFFVHFFLAAWLSARPLPTILPCRFL